MHHANILGHHVRYSYSNDDERHALEGIIKYLQASSSHEQYFKTSNTSHRVDVSSGGHTATLVTEANNYRLDLKH